MPSKFCEKHGAEYEYSVYESFGERIESLCPDCADEIQREGEAKLTALMSARNEAMRAKEIADMNIPKEHAGSTFANFNAYDAELKRYKQHGIDLTTGKISDILMVGMTGTGKTHLACAALNVMGGKYTTMYEISAMIRQSYTPKAERSELDIVRELATVPLLVIDEMGRTKGSEAEFSWLSYIVDRRHTSKLPMIIISNKHVKSDCAEHGCRDCIENYLGADVISRLSENGIVLRFNGRDYRRGWK